jgi:hypothetical protein
MPKKQSSSCPDSRQPLIAIQVTNALPNSADLRTNLQFLKDNCDLVCTLDGGDAQEYGMEFMPIFAEEDITAERSQTPLYDISCVSTAKDRADAIIGYAEKFRGFGYSVLLHLINHGDRNFPVHPLANDPVLKYPDYIEKQLLGKAIFEVTTKSSRDVSTRPYEALFARRKLITMMPSIVNYDFYNPNNILVVDEGVTKTELDAFMAKPWAEIDPEITARYTRLGWMDRLVDMALNRSRQR